MSRYNVIAMLAEVDARGKISKENRPTGGANKINAFRTAYTGLVNTRSVRARRIVNAVGKEIWS